MRLIDADKLKIRNVSADYWYTVMGVTDDDIDNAPTVKAIPIDFIKAFSEILLDRRERFVLETLIEVWEGKRETKVPYINQMLEDWEKENATEVND